MDRIDAATVQGTETVAIFASCPGIAVLLVAAAFSLASFVCVQESYAWIIAANDLFIAAR